jgi:hypothetical protein
MAAGRVVPLCLLDIGFGGAQRWVYQWVSNTLRRPGLLT